MNAPLAIVRVALLLLIFTPGPLGASALLSESPTTVAPGNPVDATWSGVDTPSRLDWIGLYVQGAQDEHSEQLDLCQQLLPGRRRQPDGEGFGHLLV
jgi:hypothetical protein